MRYVSGPSGEVELNGCPKQGKKPLHVSTMGLPKGGVFNSRLKPCMVAGALNIPRFFLLVPKKSNNILFFVFRVFEERRSVSGGQFKK